MRYQLSEGTYIAGKFSTGATVTISLYKMSDGSSVTLTSASCTEIASTGVFRWNTSNITTQPVALTEYIWIMSDGTESQYGKLVLGGYPDNVDQKLTTMESDLRGADSDTLKTLSDQLDTAQADLNNPDQFKADVSALATAAAVAAIPTNPVLDSDARLDHLDADVSSRLATAGYTSPDNAGIAAIPTNPVLDSDARLDHLDADISSRLATAGYTAPNNAGISSIDGKVDGISLMATLILGLVQHNFHLTDQVYDDDNHLTSATVTIYPTSSDLANGTNAIVSYAMTATYDGDGNCTDYRMVEV